MSYLVLARKWRPKLFDDVIGQEYITKTLKNAVASGKIAHALIFSGPRGVGKTSTARIVAMSLNCEKGSTPQPCSSCNFCLEISEGNSLDVIEIDAASHTGVKDIREIIENIKYLPSSGKTKIYIIDEAHMLSQSAFNALLKTLEEPPPHVMFILATTEVQKIPVTILSRCQRYDFKKVSTEKIKDRIKLVTSKENLKLTDETLYLIAQESDGSLRDALSLLDQLVATFGTNIKHDEATMVLGILDKTVLKKTLSAVFKKDSKMCIELLHQANEKGITPKRLAEDLLKMLRNALIIKICGGDTIRGLSKDEIKEIEELSVDQSVEKLELLFNLMLKGAEEVQKSFYPHMALEVNLLKLTLIDSTISLDNILDKIEKLYNKIEDPKNDVREKPHSQTQEENNLSRSKEDSISNSNKAQITRESNTPKTDEKKSLDIMDFINFLKEKNPVIAMQLGHADSVRVENSTIKIEFHTQSIHYDYLVRKDVREALNRSSKEFFGNNLRIKVLESSLKPNKQSISEKNSKIREKILKSPVVQDALEIFGGKIVNIKIKEKE